MAKLNKNFIAALDIGSSKVVCFIAQVSPEGEINVLGIGHQVSQGIKSGVITDVKLAEDSIRSAVGTAEQLAGITVDHVIVNISGNKIFSKIVNAELSIKGREITDRDISRLISQCSEQNKTDGRDIIHCIPNDYSIDGTEGIKNPKGMYGNELRASLNIITADSSNIINLTNCLAQCHLNVDGYINSAYASGVSCLTDDEKNLGVTLLDFGGSNVSIAVFKDGNIVYTNTVPLGGMHITNDLAIGLSTNIETAERIKTLHGNVFITAKDEREIVDIPQRTEDGSSEMVNIQKSTIINIIKPRVEEILEMTKKALNKYGKANSGGQIIITGGTSQLSGLVELTGQIFNKPVRIGTPKSIESMAESTRGPAFATCTGMLLLAAKQKKNKYFNLSQKSLVSDNLMGKVIIWLRDNF